MSRKQKWMGPVGCFGQIENIKRQSLAIRSQTGDKPLRKRIVSCYNWQFFYFSCPAFLPLRNGKKGNGVFYLRFLERTCEWNLSMKTFIQ